MISLTLDCDPRVLHATQLAQLSVQYLLGTKKVLQDKKHIIQEAVDTFAAEEDLLDMKIVKLK